MYETLMSLPLFGGASSDQFSKFVERCNLDFETFEPGETVLRPETNVRTLKCLVSGCLEIIHPIFNGRLKVIEEAGPGRFLGAERLFGLNHRLHYRAVAKSRCGTMDVDKHQYLSLVGENQVYLLNLLNYLSRPMQQLQDNLCDMASLSLVGVIASILESCTMRESENICIQSTRCPLADVLTSWHPDAMQDLKTLENSGYIKVSDCNKVEILDRNRFVGLIDEGAFK